MEWIPCSERLPEDIRPVLVTWKNNDPASYYQYIVGKHFVGTAHYHRGKWYWYSSMTEDLLAEYGKCDGEEFDEAIEAVAWMPLPEPYTADRKTEPQTETSTNAEKLQLTDEPTWEQVKEYCNKRCLDIVDSALRKKWYKDEPQTYITEDRDTQILDAWQVHHRSTTSIEDEPQTDCGWK